MKSHYGLENIGLTNIGTVEWNLNTPSLYEHAIRRNEGIITKHGPFLVDTTPHTGRSAKDKYIVEDPEHKDKIWWHEGTKPMSEDAFEKLYSRVLAYYKGRDTFVQDVHAGTDKRYTTKVRVINETAWHNLFVRTMFITPPDGDLENFVPDYTILHAPNFLANPERDGTVSSTFIILNLKKKIVIIGGTKYGGEIKKSVFTLLNYILPAQGVLSMHCSANVGPEGDTAVFFGLSGTGKTTLSADASRMLIGDDEHGWSDDGVFNLEGGCYAKMIRLSKEAEPEIYSTTQRYGTILENVVCDETTRELDLDSDKYTENTRGAYPLHFIPNAHPDGYAGHPKNVIMLTADAFGVLPPISRMNPTQAMYHFISGYTAKVAGTEKGIIEPEATFSACFGAPFMARPPTVYAALLKEKVTKHNVSCWLVNTGWTGGPYGVGSRMPIQHTRALLNAVLEGRLDNVKMETDPIFGLEVPVAVDGVPSEILTPRKTWKNGADYDAKAKDLAVRFRENFKQFTDPVAIDVAEGGPKG